MASISWTKSLALGCLGFWALIFKSGYDHFWFIPNPGGKVLSFKPPGYFGSFWALLFCSITGSSVLSLLEFMVLNPVPPHFTPGMGRNKGGGHRIEDRHRTPRLMWWSHCRVNQHWGFMVINPIPSHFFSLWEEKGRGHRLEGSHRTPGLLWWSRCRVSRPWGSIWSLIPFLPIFTLYGKNGGGR